MRFETYEEYQVWSDEQERRKAEWKAEGTRLRKEREATTGMTQTEEWSGLLRRFFQEGFDLGRFRQSVSYRMGMKATRIAFLMQDWLDANDIGHPKYGTLVPTMRYAVDHANASDASFPLERREGHSYRPYFLKEVP